MNHSYTLIYIPHIPENAAHWIFGALGKNRLLVKTDTILTDSIRIWFNIPTNIKNLIARYST